MKYVSMDRIELYYQSQTEKSICFMDYSQRYSDEPKQLWIPKNLIKVAANNENDAVFFVPSWYYMNNVRGKLYARNGIPKHITEEQIKSVYTHFINATEVELH